MGSGCTANRGQNILNSVEKARLIKDEDSGKGVLQTSPAKEDLDNEIVGDIPLKEIWGAIEKNDLAKIRKILRHSEISPAELVNAKGQSILHFTAEVGSPEAISLIIDANIPGISPDILNSSLCTPLHTGILGRKLEVVKALLNYGVDANIEEENGHSPLMLCALHSIHDIAKVLLEANTAGKLSEPLSVNSHDRNGMCPLQYSLRNGDLQMCKLLLEIGKANPDEPGPDGIPGLIFCAKKGDSKLTDLLVKNKANKEMQDDQHNTAIHYAVDLNHTEVIEILLKAQADGNAVDKYGRSPLTRAVLAGSEESIELLIENQVDVNSLDYSGRSALFYACRDEKFEIVQLLIEKGCADPNLYSLPNPIMEKMMQIRGEDLTKIQLHAFNSCRAPIHSAAAGGFTDIIEYLVSKGARISEPGKYNNSAYHIAAFAGNILVAKTLIQLGVNIAIKNSKGLLAKDVIAKYYPVYAAEIEEEEKEIVKHASHPREDEFLEQADEDELTMSLAEATIDDLRISALAIVYGDKIAAALLSAEKKFKAFKWILKNYLNSDITAESVRALMGAVTLGIEERVMKINLTGIQILESLIFNASSFITNKILEENNTIDLLFGRAMNTSERLFAKILDLLPKLADLSTVGIDYLVVKSLNILRRTIKTMEEPLLQTKAMKDLSVVLMIILRLIESFGPDCWLSTDLHELVVPLAESHNKILRSKVAQVITIMKEMNPVPRTVSIEVAPSKKGAQGGVEEAVLVLREQVNALGEFSATGDWEERFNDILKVLSERNIMNYLAGVEICEAFLYKALEFQRGIIEGNFLELVKPVVLKIDSTNKRVKAKCRGLITQFWKDSIRGKDFLHVHLAQFIFSSEQSKIYLGAIEILLEIIAFIQEQKIKSFQLIEEALGTELSKLIKLAADKIAHKVPNIRQVSSNLLIQISNLSALIDTTYVEALASSFEESLKSQKPAIKDKLLEQFHKSILTSLKKLAQKRFESPDKNLKDEEESPLIYAEPLSEDLKKKLTPALNYFSEEILTCLHSQNWASRAAALTKIKEELMYATSSEVSNSYNEFVPRNVNIRGFHVNKSTEAWFIVLQHILADPVIKIYIEAVELLKEILVIFKKYLINKDEAMKIIDPLVSIIIEKLNDQKPKIREKSIELLISLLQDSLIQSKYLSDKLMMKFQQGSLSGNLMLSILKIIIECIDTFKLGERDAEALAAYSELMNKSLVHQLPGVRALGETLFVSLQKLHGDTVLTYINDLKPKLKKRLQGLVKTEPKVEQRAQITPSPVPGIVALRSLADSGNDLLLNSEDTAERIKGLIGIKKYLAKQVSSTEISADRAHELLDELLMLLRTVLNDSCPEVYIEALGILKYALSQLLSRLSPFDLQITINQFISLLVTRAVASLHHKIQITTDKFLISLGKESLIGPVVILKNILRLIDKLASEYSTFYKNLRLSTSQHGFNRTGYSTTTSGDTTQNVAMTVKYLGMINLVLAHYKTGIAYSKEAIECLCESIVTLSSAYSDKAQVKEGLVMIVKEIVTVDEKAFDGVLLKRNSEAKSQVIEILKLSKETLEQEMATSFRGGNKMSIIISEKAKPPPYMTSFPREDKKGPTRPLPSYSKRLGKNTEKLPPLPNSPATSSLPPLVMRKVAPESKFPEPKVEIPKKPIWLSNPEEKVLIKKESQKPESDELQKKGFSSYGYYH